MPTPPEGVPGCPILRSLIAKGGMSIAPQHVQIIAVVKLVLIAYQILIVRVAWAQSLSLLATQKSLKQGYSKRIVSVRGAVNHPFPDEGTTERTDGCHFDAQPLRDLS